MIYIPAVYFVSFAQYLKNSQIFLNFLYINTSFTTENEKEAALYTVENQTDMGFNKDTIQKSVAFILNSKKFEIVFKLTVFSLIEL